MGSEYHPATLWEANEDGSVTCALCRHGCTLQEGGWGLCGVRQVRDGALWTTVYGQAIAVHVDPIEKKPLFHFYPGTRCFSVATVGCNFCCTFCQNWTISQVRERLRTGDRLAPEALVRQAQDSDSRSVAFTYTEPTVFFEYAFDTATLARERGIDTVFVTNGYFSEQALDRIAPVLGGANVDLKCFREETYRRRMGGRLGPVLDNLRELRRRGVWVEVTTLVVPEMNDSPGELEQIATFISEELGPEVPWHVSRFRPDHEMTDRGATPVATLQRAYRIGNEAGLRHVFVGNLPGDDSESSRCHGCGTTLVRRWGYRILENRVSGGRCPDCATPMAGVGL